jgi:signal transduction histidine kinase
VTEGLNNILRHTAARQASVIIGQDEGAVSVEIRNECSAPEGAMFTPRSITDRVTEVGGTVSVRHCDGTAVVLARIPLEVCRAAT